MRTESLADAGDSVLEPVQQGHPENTSSMMGSSGKLAAAYEYDEFKPVANILNAKVKDIK